MRTLLFLLLLIGLSRQGARAQLGLEAGMLQTQTEEWMTFADEMAGVPFARAASGRYFTLSYRFRLRPVRIEFSPGIRFSNQVFRLSPNETRPLATRAMAVEWPVLVYPFDLGSDCDCPTFSKQGPTLEKGLFLAIVPIGQWQQYRPPEGARLPKGEQILPALALRAGLDIGLSDAWTLTLQGGVCWFDTWRWDNFALLFPDQPDAPARTEARGLDAGLVLRYRWKR